MNIPLPGIGATKAAHQAPAEQLTDYYEFAAVEAVIDSQELDDADDSLRCT